jgi:redox-sensitive bicupin YhaK (pirin superfamily)
MITLRPSAQRGRTRLDWLDSRHTFSFGGYHDPRWVRFQDLRVINEDWVEPEAGFGMHPHQDMEIITVQVDGELRHRDSLGSGSTLRAGEVQVMSAGTGISHSEANPSRGESSHLLQIWILPERKGIEPRYEQKAFPETERRGRLQPVATPDGRGGSLRIHQDASLFLGSMESGKSLSYAPAPGRHAWVQVARGAVELNGMAMKQGDGAAVSDETSLRLLASEDSDILLFDLR